MKIEVSVGEVLDKITILKIKSQKITDKDKLQHVKNELNILEDTLRDEGVAVPAELVAELQKVNETLWDTEDIIRECERNDDFGSEFVKHARLDAKLNDERFLIKNKINIISESLVQEQKSYDGLY